MKDKIIKIAEYLKQGTITETKARTLLLVIACVMLSCFLNINNLKIKIMSELKEEHLVFMSDEMYTPIHYKGMIVKQPFFEGKGNHSVAKLEEICEQFKEYCHQQAIIKQNCMKHIVELKFGVEFPQHEA